MSWKLTPKDSGSGWTSLHLRRLSLAACIPGTALPSAPLCPLRRRCAPHALTGQIAPAPKATPYPAQRIATEISALITVLLGPALRLELSALSPFYPGARRGPKNSAFIIVLLGRPRHPKISAFIIVLLSPASHPEILSFYHCLAQSNASPRNSQLLSLLYSSLLLEKNRYTVYRVPSQSSDT